MHRPEREARATQLDQLAAPERERVDHVLRAPARGRLEVPPLHQRGARPQLDEPPAARLASASVRTGAPVSASASGAFAVTSVVHGSSSSRSASTARRARSRERPRVGGMTGSRTTGTSRIEGEPAGQGADVRDRPERPQLDGAHALGTDDLRRLLEDQLRAERVAREKAVHRLHGDQATTTHPKTPTAWSARKCATTPAPPPGSARRWRERMEPHASARA